MIKQKLKTQVAFIYSRKFLFAFGIMFCVITLSEFIYFSALEKEDYLVNFNDSSKIVSIHIPRNINFAGEVIPTSNYQVRKNIAIELIASTYWRSQSQSQSVLHERAYRWFPIIEPILKQNNIPDDFKYIALIESHLTNVVSPRGAAGFWQFMEPTAKRYNLEITDDIDERFSVIKSTHAACKYFNEAYKLFNNWTLVAASYNRGMGGIQTQMVKQNKKDYYDLYLTKETSQYVFKLLAMKETISRPQIYGYKINSKNKKLPFVDTKKISVDTTIHNLTHFAKDQGTEITLLKAATPWLRSNKLFNPENKKYIIEVPKNSQPFYDVDGNYIELNAASNDSTNNNFSTMKDSLANTAPSTTK